MKYSEIEVKNMLKVGELSLEEQVKFNILNFIRVMHLNQQDFIESSFATEFFGELPMTFRKYPGQVVGLITATINGEVQKFVFTDQGYEPLEEILKLTKK
ncbi:hypothetical protein [Isachenkonia alkalipeptolytica]|uniref:Uncharacterized protein n=1 Tax=Isachenkonia alkalipeptolytica TaxID=2565777 RepID=A0AA44BG63_9CLOT|nr:hypothetical protein [Isachenkonia alkalipeptolytica]NBG89520.1 hypothetical protein [Isachenkonia alkalipeptolytica]